MGYSKGKSKKRSKNANQKIKRTAKIKKRKK